MSFIKFAALAALALSSAAAFAGEQTSGGWGQNCQTINITCNSSQRQLGCNATVGDAQNRSECVVHWGDHGWVSCRVYDPAGNVLASYADQCP